MLRTFKSLVYKALQWGTTERRRRERNPNRSSHLERSDTTEWWHTCAVHWLVYAMPQSMHSVVPKASSCWFDKFTVGINYNTTLHTIFIHSFFFCSSVSDKSFFSIFSLAGPWNEMKGVDWLVILITHIISAHLPLPPLLILVTPFPQPQSFR